MILHIVTKNEWSQALARGELRPPSLAEAGFVHCSDFGTVHIPANQRYAGHTDLLLAVVDPARVPTRWEAGVPPIPGGPWFPHVYGPIPTSAVVATHDFPPDEHGEFHLPAALATT